MTDSEMLARLLPPVPPGSGAAILRRFAASEGWRVDRIMGSGGVFVVEVTYLPLGCHGHMVCQPIGDDLYAVHQIGSPAQGVALPCATTGRKREATAARCPPVAVSLAGRRGRVTIDTYLAATAPRL